MSIAQVTKDQPRSEVMFSVALANERTVIVVFTQILIKYQFKYLN